MVSPTSRYKTRKRDDVGIVPYLYIILSGRFVNRPYAPIIVKTPIRRF